MESGTVAADEFQRSSVGNGDLRWELSVVVVGKQVKGNADLLLIIKARNKVCWPASGGSSWQKQHQEDRQNADHHKNFYNRHCLGRSPGGKLFHSPGIIPNRAAAAKPELPGLLAVCWGGQRSLDTDCTDFTRK